jgi:hypothetical protein
MRFGPFGGGESAPMGYSPGELLNLANTIPVPNPQEIVDAQDSGRMMNLASDYFHSGRQLETAFGPEIGWLDRTVAGMVVDESVVNAVLNNDPTNRDAWIEDAYTALRACARRQGIVGNPLQQTDPKIHGYLDGLRDRLTDRNPKVRQAYATAFGKLFALKSGINHLNALQMEEYDREDALRAAELVDQDPSNAAHDDEPATTEPDEVDEVLATPVEDPLQYDEEYGGDGTEENDDGPEPASGTLPGGVTFIDDEEARVGDGGTGDRPSVLRAENGPLWPTTGPGSDDDRHPFTEEPRQEWPRLDDAAFTVPATPTPVSPAPVVSAPVSGPPAPNESAHREPVDLRRPVVRPAAQEEVASPPATPEPEAGGRAGAAARVARYLITGPVSLGAWVAMGKADLKEGMGRTIERLPVGVRALIRAADIGGLVCIGVGVYRVYSGAKMYRDASQNNATGLLDLRDEVNSYFEKTKGADTNQGAYEPAPDMVHASHTTKVETPTGPDFGYEDDDREALKKDPGTGRASNVTDWSKQSYTYILKEYGATDEQIAQFFKDNPNAINDANKAFFESNPSVNTKDGFGGGLNAGDTYDTYGQNDTAWSNVGKWAEANNLTTPEDPVVPPNEGDTGEPKDQKPPKEDKPGQPANPGSSASPTPTPGASSSPAAPPASDPPSNPASSSSEPAPASSEPAAPPASSEASPSPDAGHSQGTEGAAHDDGKPEAPGFVRRFVDPALVGIAAPAMFTAIGYLAGEEAASRARRAGVARKRRDRAGYEIDDDD